MGAQTHQGHSMTLEKLVEYATFGVSYYWIVDPEARTFEVLQRTRSGTYEIVVSAAEGQVAIPSCQGLQLDLDALWAETEDFEPDA